MMTPAQLMASMAAMIDSRMNRKPGPIKWCNQCSRYHAARGDCGLHYVKRTAKSGKEVWRWAHV